MKKKKKIFLIVLSCTSLLVAFIIYAVLSIVISELLLKECSILSIYEEDYNIKIRLWWIYLIFVPFCILPILIGIKYKDKLVVSVALVMMIVMNLITFINFRDTKKYSTNEECLFLIEEKINYDFPEETTILIKKDAFFNKNNNFIYEGSIRLPMNIEYRNDLEENITWHSQIDNTLEDYLSEQFRWYVCSLNKFTYNIDENNTLVFLAYYSEKDLILFYITEIIE